MSIDSDSSNPSGGQQPKKPKLKLKTKSGSKGAKKTSLKLGKKKASRSCNL